MNATIAQKRKSTGQSLVEFALTITLIFMFLSAVIDLGLAFFALQGLAGAAQEGAAYAALVPVKKDASGAVATTNDDEIRARTRYEAGLVKSNGQPLYDHQARFVNLLDLNNDKAIDNPTQLKSLIEIKTVKSFANNSTVNVPCSDTTVPPQRNAQYCDMQVTVQYTYRSFFWAASLLGMDKITLKATRQQTIGQ